MKEFLEYFEYARIYLIVSLIIILITFILHLISKKNKLTKYIPGILLIPIGLYGILTLSSTNGLIAGVNKLVIFVVGVGGGFVGLLTAFFLGSISKGEGRRKKKRKNKEKDKDMDIEGNHY